MRRTYKIPQSVLVVIYTPALDVLLIKRVDAADFWQSVTGSKDTPEEPYRRTAEREVFEETGIECGHGTLLESCLIDWRLDNEYDIYPQWQRRYAPGVTRNAEHLFGLEVPGKLPICLNPREHTDQQWLPYRQASALCFSRSNAEAILMLPRFLIGQGV
jgi:dATP pyrophosphohydrolase